MSTLMTKEDRKNPNLVLRVVMATINIYGNAKLDCGHCIQQDAEAILIEKEDGQFMTACSLCESRKN